MFGCQMWSENGGMERVLMGGKNLFMLTQVSGLRSGLGSKGSEKGACFWKQNWWKVCMSTYYLCSGSRTEVTAQGTNKINFLDPFKS